MSKPSDVLSQLASAVAARAESARDSVAAIGVGHARYITGFIWQPGIVIASEQALPRREDFELIAPGGATISAKAAGRDASTNIAILKTASSLGAPALSAAEGNAGAIALAAGSDGEGGASMRLGIVNLAGGEWHSSRGGLIDRRIVLDIELAHREEGGPVFDAEGLCLGMSTFGPRGRVIVIPFATIARVVPQLVKEGRVARGWLGVALQAVAVPDALRESAGQSSGLMVMSVVENAPAARAGIVAGDIILSVDGTSVHRFRKIVSHFGSDSIGRRVEIRLIRGGAVIAVQTTIEERQAA